MNSKLTILIESFYLNLFNTYRLTHLTDTTLWCTFFSLPNIIKSV